MRSQLALATEGELITALMVFDDYYTLGWDGSALPIRVGKTNLTQAADTEEATVTSSLDHEGMVVTSSIYADKAFQASSNFLSLVSADATLLLWSIKEYSSDKYVITSREITDSESTFTAGTDSKVENGGSTFMFDSTVWPMYAVGKFSIAVAAIKDNSGTPELEVHSFTMSPMVSTVASASIDGASGETITLKDIWIQDEKVFVAYVVSGGSDDTNIYVQGFATSGSTALFDDPVKVQGTETETITTTDHVACGMYDTKKILCVYKGSAKQSIIDFSSDEASPNITPTTLSPPSNTYQPLDVVNMASGKSSIVLGNMENDMLTGFWIKSTAETEGRMVDTGTDVENYSLAQA